MFEALSKRCCLVGEHLHCGANDQCLAMCVLAHEMTQDHPISCQSNRFSNWQTVARACGLALALRWSEQSKSGLRLNGHGRQTLQKPRFQGSTRWVSRRPVAAEPKKRGGVRANKARDQARARQRMTRRGRSGFLL